MIPWQEYKFAKPTGEGSRYGYGICRTCGREASCMVDWREPTGATAQSNSWRADCTHPKCQDLFPATITRMAANPEYQPTALGRQFQDILSAIESAIEKEDATGESMGRDSLTALRMALGGTE